MLTSFWQHCLWGDHAPLRDSFLGGLNNTVDLDTGFEKPAE
jgi:hypothetical protein